MGSTLVPVVRQALVGEILAQTLVACTGRDQHACVSAGTNNDTETQEVIKRRHIEVDRAKAVGHDGCGYLGKGSGGVIESEQVLRLQVGYKSIHDCITRGVGGRSDQDVGLRIVHENLESGLSQRLGLSSAYCGQVNYMLINVVNTTKKFNWYDRIVSCTYQEALK